MLKDAVLLGALPPRPLLPPFLGPGVGGIIGGGGEVVAMVAMVAMVVMVVVVVVVVVMVHAAGHAMRAVRWSAFAMGARGNHAVLPLQVPIPIAIARPCCSVYKAGPPAHEPTRHPSCPKPSSFPLSLTCA